MNAFYAQVHTFVRAHVRESIAVAAFVVFLLIATIVYVIWFREESTLPLPVAAPTFELGSDPAQAASATVSGTLARADEALLAAKVAGSLVSLSVRAGDTVRAGEVIAEIDHGTIDAELGVARAELSRAEAEYARQVALSASGKEVAGIGVESARVSKETQVRIAQENYEDALERARSVSVAEAAELLSLLVLLTDTQEQWRGTNGLYNEFSVTSDRMRAAEILVGADGAAATWASTYLARLMGGVRGEVSRGALSSIDTEIVISQLLDVTHALHRGFTEVQSVVIARGSSADAESVTSALARTAATRTHLIAAEQAMGSARTAHLVAMETAAIEESSAAQGLDSSVSGYDTAVAAALRAVESARARVSAVYAQRDNAFVKSPFTGLVTDTFADVGDSVSPGTRVASVASREGWKASFSITDSFNEHIVPGTPVTLSVSGVSGSFESVISRVIPAAETGSRRTRFEVYLSDIPEHARSGAVVRGALAFSESSERASAIADDTYAVPNAFIGYDYDGAYVVNESGVRAPVVIVTRGAGSSVVSDVSFPVGTLLVYPHR